MGGPRTLAAQRLEGDLEICSAAACGDDDRHGGRVHRLDSVAPSHARPRRPQPVSDPGGGGALRGASARGPAPCGRRARPARAPFGRPRTRAGGPRAPAWRPRRGRRGGSHPRAERRRGPRAQHAAAARAARPRGGPLDGAAGAPAPPQPASLLRDRRGRPRRWPLLPLPPPQHAARPCPQLPRLATRGGRLRGGARPAPADRLRGGRPLRGAERLRGGQSALMGVPGDRLDVLPHYLPAEAFAEHSRADQGSYALVASRLSPEKGIDAAIEAAAPPASRCGWRGRARRRRS